MTTLRETDSNGMVPVSADMGDVFEETQHQFSITGTALAAEKDQMPFYNLLTDIPKSATHILGSPSPVETGWTAANIARYIADRPAALQNIHLTDASNDTVLGTARFESVRNTPDGGLQASVLYGARYRDPNQFQQAIMSVPIKGGLGLDGYTYLRIITTGNAAAVTYTATMTFALSMDQRAGIPRVRGLVVKDASR